MRILIIAFCLSSCGFGGNRKATSTTDSLTTVHPVSGMVESCQAKIGSDSLAFERIIKSLAEAGYEYDCKDVKCGSGDSKNDGRFGFDENELHHLADSLVYFRSVYFDYDVVQKPMCSIDQLMFTSDSAASEYLKNFIKASKYNEDPILATGFNYSLSRNTNIVYIFASFFREMDNGLWEFKGKIDDSIIQPDEVGSTFQPR